MKSDSNKTGANVLYNRTRQNKMSASGSKFLTAVDQPSFYLYKIAWSMILKALTATKPAKPNLITKTVYTDRFHLNNSYQEVNSWRMVYQSIVKAV